jgi:hypothetical protein
LPRPPRSLPGCQEAAPLPFTEGAFVTGTASTYAGGASTSSGTNQHAVQGRDVSPAGSRQGGRARAVSLDEANWSCPWPREADNAGIDEQTVLLRVEVDAGGGVREVKISATAVCGGSRRRGYGNMANDDITIAFPVRPFSFLVTTIFSTRAARSMRAR